MRFFLRGFEMDSLLEAITDVAGLVSPEKIQALASKIRKVDVKTAKNSLSDVVGTAAAKTNINRLVDAWQTTSIGSEELASMLLAASYALAHESRRQSIELVWTGPTTPFVSARRTEQALLQVINSATRILFVTSFVAYDVSSIVQALNNASARGVSTSMLLESSKGHGGSVTFDVIDAMRRLVPSAKLYAWRQKSASFSEGRVHAKVAVADGEICFITSANLTGHAMEQNMEAGVLITGGRSPAMLLEHLAALVSTQVVMRV